jgi:hypothetical protein
MALTDTPPDLTPRITRHYDSVLLQHDATARAVTIIRFMIGPFGPFEEVLDRNPDNFAIREAIEKRRNALSGLV